MIRVVLLRPGEPLDELAAAVEPFGATVAAGGPRSVVLTVADDGDEPSARRAANRWANRPIPPEGPPLDEQVAELRAEVAELRETVEALGGTLPRVRP